MLGARPRTFGEQVALAGAVALGAACSGCASAPAPTVVVVEIPRAASAPALRELAGTAANGFAHPLPKGHWSGKCDRPPNGWGRVDAFLSFVPRGDDVRVEGTLVFAGRRATAELVGHASHGVVELRGTMKEIGGLGTEWRIALSVNEDGDGALLGSFQELVDGRAPTKMCSFVWHRRAGDAERP